MFSANKVRQSLHQDKQSNYFEPRILQPNLEID